MCNIFKFSHFKFAGNLESKILQLFKDNPEAHFFFDEFPFGLNGLQPEELIKISSKLSEKIFLWIACQYQNNPMSEDLQNCGNHLNESN
jgi:hypothetical protein